MAAGNILLQANDSKVADIRFEDGASGNLISVQHYVGSVIKGTTTLSYTSGALTSAVFVGV